MHYNHTSSLIFAELDTWVEPIDKFFFEEFIKYTESEHIKNGHDKEEKLYVIRNNRKYPWDRRLLEFQGKKFYNYDLIPEFKNLFNIVTRLPIEESSRVVLMLHQKNQMEYDFNYHFDKDDVFGFRICYGLNIEKCFLELKKIKSGVNSENKILESDTEGTIITVIPKKSDTVFMLPGDTYAHRVPIINNSNSRVSIIVRGKLHCNSELNFSQCEYAK